MTTVFSEATVNHRLVSLYNGQEIAVFPTKQITELLAITEGDGIREVLIKTHSGDYVLSNKDVDMYTAFSVLVGKLYDINTSTNPNLTSQWSTSSHPSAVARGVKERGSSYHHGFGGRSDDS